MELDDFDRIMSEKGWVVFNDVVDDSLVERMKKEVYSSYENTRKLQEQAGISSDTAYTVHHLIGQGQTFLEYIDINPIGRYIERYFGGKYILNSFGGAINLANSSSYANNVHRDIRTFSGNKNLILNTLIMLDDFTEENGPTEMLSGSHHMESKPSDEYFNKYSEQALGKKGSILFFNSNVWHKGGVNNTASHRVSVTPMYSVPYLKQQFDYPKVVGYENADKLSEQSKQIIGFNSRVPTSLEEWYQPPEKRMYRPDQG